MSVRERIHGMWSSVAPAWRDHADDVDARGAALAARMLELAAPEAGDRVLELACGPGGLGIAAARRVGGGGEVTLSDVSEEMLAIAGARAAVRVRERRTSSYRACRPMRVTTSRPARVQGRLWET